MNFTAFKKLISNLPDDLTELYIIDKTTGHKYIFDISVNNRMIEQDNNTYFELSIEK